MDPVLGCVICFILLDRAGQDTYRRLGTGQTADAATYGRTADATDGYTTNALDLAILQRKRFEVV